MEKFTLSAIFLSIAFILSSCSTIATTVSEKPDTMKSNIKQELESIPPVDGPQMTVAVYSFLDKTGQKKSSDTVAQLSSAVTQGAEVWVIKALQDIGNGSWFKVVERVGVENLIKERQMIRQAREAYEGSAAKQLKPMLFAGLILEGGIIGYDSSISSGGAGARLLGIGAQVQYSTDVVVVAARLISVQTGEVLLSVAVTKTVLSISNKATLLKFFDTDKGPLTMAVEAEIGFAGNEPVNYAVRSAIEKAIVELVKEGVNKQLWKYKTREEK